MVLIVTVVTVALVAAGSVTATARVRSSSDRILAGVRIDGVDVGGMAREQAVAAVWRHVAPGARRLGCRHAAGDRAWSGQPAGHQGAAPGCPGILIHGSWASGSIGGYASHGCIRMRIWDAEDLYPRVPAGSQVLIYRS